jgi:predicted TIM-barrel fold metal-dependent hydrolase
MPVRGTELFEALLPLWLDGREVLGDDVRWFDAHTHIGCNDPDGTRATAHEILAGLDAAGHERALLFSLHEPAGYPAANDAVLAAAAQSGVRFVPLCRVDPNADPLAEARRCLAAGARGFKLHPRSDAFELPHPAVEEVVALAAQHRMPVVFHAGRGIPHLGDAVTDLARRNPDARLILAHAGISDLGRIVPAASELTNLYFDTAWWQVGDLLALFTTIPPGRILYGSDMPYAPGLGAAFFFLRAARAAGLSPQQLRAVAGGQLSRIVDGEDPIDLGPAPGPAALGARSIACERVVAYCVSALQGAFRGGDPTEALALARLGCQTYPGQDGAVAVLIAADALLERAQATFASMPDSPQAILPAAAAAMTIAGTPGVGAPRIAV